MSLSPVSLVVAGTSAAVLVRFCDDLFLIHYKI
jgi:hypothetical protein